MTLCAFDIKAAYAVEMDFAVANANSIHVDLLNRRVTIKEMPIDNLLASLAESRIDPGADLDAIAKIPGLKVQMTQSLSDNQIEAWIVVLHQASHEFIEVAVTALAENGLRDAATHTEKELAHLADSAMRGVFWRAMN